MSRKQVIPMPDNTPDEHPWQPEPWGIERKGDSEYVFIRTNDDCNLLLQDPCIYLPDAERIVACVNACAGIPTALLENWPHRYINALKKMSEEGDPMIRSDEHPEEYAWRAQLQRGQRQGFKRAAEMLMGTPSSLFHTYPEYFPNPKEPPDATES
jgi:hypothetical protein